MRFVEGDYGSLNNVRRLPQPGVREFCLIGIAIRYHAGSGYVNGIGRAKHSTVGLSFEIGVSGLYLTLRHGDIGFAIELNALSTERAAGILHPGRTREGENFVCWNIARAIGCGGLLSLLIMKVSTLDHLFDRILIVEGGRDFLAGGDLIRS